jgi:hypothetical protein
MLRLIFRGGYNLWQSNIVSCGASLVTNGEGPLGQEPQDLDSKRQNGCALCSTKILFVRCIIESSVTALLRTEVANKGILVCTIIRYYVTRSESYRPNDL